MDFALEHLVLFDLDLADAFVFPGFPLHHLYESQVGEEHAVFKDDELRPGQKRTACYCNYGHAPQPNESR